MFVSKRLSVIFGEFKTVVIGYFTIVDYTNLLNPKVAVFFLTFLPQFLNPNHNTLVQLFIMGLTYLVLTVIWFSFYIFLIDKISTFMKKPTTQKYVQGLTGIVLIGFGIKLAFEKSN